jgi:hypothetical protein
MSARSSSNMPARARRAVRRGAPRLALLAVLVAAVASVGATPAHASRAAFGPPAGGPDLSQMAFAASDFPGSRVRRQGYVKPDGDLGFIAEYDREFRELSVKLGRKRLLGLEDDVSLARSVDGARSAISALTLAFGLGSDEIGQSIAADFGVRPEAVKVGRPTKAGAGEESVAIRIAVKMRSGEMDLIVAVVRVGRVDSIFYFAGQPKTRLGVADTKRLARLAESRTRVGLSPANTSLPLVSGIAQVSQFVTAAPGTWSNAPTTFAYQWQRCDPTGGACTDISGATGQSYSVTTADVGQTLRVAVTARNKYGSASAPSAPTAVVSVAGAPVDISLPTISGSATVGQTLTAAPGSWSGSPTTYAYQWQRCTGQGAGCMDIAGAVSQSYPVSSADVGSTLRVVVTATNASGSASAASAITAVVT